MSVSHLGTLSLIELVGPPALVDRAVLMDRMRVLDPDLWIHAGLVAEAAQAMAIAMSLSDDEQAHLIDAAWLHDLGKLTISRAILDKPGALDACEWNEMRAHAPRGADYLALVPGLEEVVPLVRQHHERFDGAGYPDGIGGVAIPLGARILGVVDAFDAMTSERPYRRAIPEVSALTELQRCASTQFDPAIVDLFCSIANRSRKGTDA